MQRSAPPAQSMRIFPSLALRPDVDRLFSMHVSPFVSLMKRNGILNLGLNQAIAAMGSRRFSMIVLRRRFPIPAQVTRVDLAIVADVPISKRLTAISGDFIAENSVTPPRWRKNNPPLKEKSGPDICRGRAGDLSTAQILTELAEKAKFIVRTGAFDPWGTSFFTSGVEVPSGLAKTGYGGAGILRSA